MIQTLLVASAAGLSVLYFIRGAYRDLCGGSRGPGSSCGACRSKGCPSRKA